LNYWRFAKLKDDESWPMKFLSWVSSKWRLIPLLDRWLLGELIQILLFAIVAFTVVCLSAGVMFDLVRKIVEFHLPLHFALQAFSLRVPYFLVISFPMSTLLCTLLAYSRLSSNSELTALRSLGITTRRMIAPALVLAIFMTGLTFVFNDVIVPRANSSADVVLKRALGKSIATEKGKHVTFSRFGQIRGAKAEDTTQGLTHLFYSREFNRDKMQDVTVIDLSRLGYTQMLKANRGVWNEQKAMWEFFDGNILTLTPTGSMNKIKFDRYLYSLDSGPVKVAKLPKDAINMTVAQAMEAEKIYKDAGNRKEVRKIKVRIQEKFTLPMTCLVFGLIGSSLGARPNSRTSRIQGFGICILLIFGYYTLSFSFSSLGLIGTLPPVLAPWLPILISLAAGGVLLHQSSK
tara:strand:- start:8314 stop:9525 length:1212 start_codon:yes stop_codon:yes gene_type:complete